MNKTSGTQKDTTDKLVRVIKRKTRKHYSAEETIRIVLAGLRGEPPLRNSPNSPRDSDDRHPVKNREITRLTICAPLAMLSSKKQTGAE